METTASMTPAQRKGGAYADRLRAAADLIDTYPDAANSNVEVRNYDSDIDITTFNDPAAYLRLVDTLGAITIEARRHDGDVQLWATGTYRGHPIRIVTIVKRVPGMVIPHTGWTFPAAWLDGRFTGQVSS